MRRSARFPLTMCAFVLVDVTVRPVTAAEPRVAAGPPEILKVEPPGWWAGHSLNPVRVMIRGRNLAGANVEVVGEALHAPGGVGVNDAGTYLFADVRIDPGVKPGPRALRISTGAGAAQAPFEVLEPLDRRGRFQGISRDDAIYLLMPDRFANGDPSNDDPPGSRGLLDRGKPRYYHGGDFQGVIDRLPYLKDLGVTAIWLNPWYDNVNHLNERETYDGKPITDYHGYGAVDFYGVEEHFGSLAKLRELVGAAQKLGLKVIQDQVANHTGPYHPWVKDPPTSTWLNGTVEKHLANTWQTWTLTDPHATLEMQESTLKGWFIDVLPDLNQDDPEVARYLIQSSLWWIGTTGIDAIRQDTLPYVHRRFWRDWTSAIRREYPGFTVVGEFWDGDAAAVSFFQGGKPRADGIDSGIDALFDFPLYYPLRRAFAEGKPLRDVATTFGRDHLYVDPTRLVTFAGLHDVPRFLNEPGATITGLKLAFTLAFTARGIPLLYYGDEIAMRGGGDPDNRRDFPGGWPGDARSAFERSGRTPDEESVLEHVRKLGHLRAELVPLRRGRMVHLAVAEQTYAYARVAEGSAAIVVLNNSKDPATVACGIQAAGVRDGDLLVDRLGIGPDVRAERGRLQVTLPARTACVYAAKKN